MYNAACDTLTDEFGPANVTTVFEDKANPGAHDILRLILDEATTLCFGVHWAALPALPQELKAKIAEFWMTHGLVETVDDGLNFLT